jgi:hypothetical protein
VLYAIIAEDVPDSLALRQRHRPAHLQRLRRLQADGRLLLAGPCPAIDSPDPGAAGFTGSLIIAEFETLDDAERWAQTDPFVSGGVYARVAVRPFRKSFPE